MLLTLSLLTFINYFISRFPTTVVKLHILQCRDSLVVSVLD